MPTHRLAPLIGAPADAGDADRDPKADLALYARLDAVGQAVAELERRLHGDPARQKLDEPDTPSIGDRIGAIRDGHWQTRQMPTATQRRNLQIATAGLDALERDLKALIAGDLRSWRRPLRRRRRRGPRGGWCRRRTQGGDGKRI